MRITRYRSLKAAAIHKLALRKILVKLLICQNALFILRLWDTRFGACAREVDIGTVSGVILINIPAISIFVIGRHTFRGSSFTLSDGSFLTTAKNLEYIATIQINGGTAPYLRLKTLATAEDVQRTTEHVHTLLTKDNTRVSLLDSEGIAIEFFLSSLVIRFHLVEDDVTVNDGSIDINDDITIHNTTLAAAAVDVSTRQTTVQVIRTGQSILTTR